MLPIRAVRPVRKQHTYRAILLVSAIFIAGAIFMAMYRHPQAQMESKAVQGYSISYSAAEEKFVALPESVQLGLPAGWSLESVTPADNELWAGKLLLIDEDHSVPDKMPAPNTLSIATMGKGRIAVRSMKPNANEETIDALAELFRYGKENGAASWLVWEGSRSNGQQLDMQLETLKQYAQTMSLLEAAEQAAAKVPGPGHSEHQLPWVIDIRLANGWNVMPDTAPLSASPDGRLLIDNAWKFGFVHRYGTKMAPPYEDEAYHFRYVGVVHSTLMHVLSLDLPSYLAFLHEKETITYYEGGKPRFAILCKELKEGLSFQVPKECIWEGSMDNTGYAVLAVTFSQDTEE